MKTKLISILVLAVSLPVLAFAGMAGAQTLRSGQSTTVASSESIDGSVFITGSTIDVAGNINGDLYCAGQTVTISGEVDGDILCAAQTITVSGFVTGDVRLAGQTVAVSGDIDGSATLAGQAITLEGKGRVNRDAVLVGQTASLNGRVTRDVTIAASSATMDSTIGRNVTAQIENLTLGKNAAIAGTVNYTSPNLLTKSDQAQVAGKVNYTKWEAPKQSNTSYNAGGAILWALMLVVSALIVVLLFPRELQRATSPSVGSLKQTLVTLVVGFIASIVAPVAILMLVVTILGIPLALVALTGWILILALSGAFAAYYLGRIVWRTQTNAVLVMVVGALILVVALMIPVLNVLVWLLAVWYGIGAILLRLKSVTSAPRYDITNLPSKRKK